MVIANKKAPAQPVLFYWVRRFDGTTASHTAQEITGKPSPGLAEARQRDYKS
jgi:hypothetical protein